MKWYYQSNIKEAWEWSGNSNFRDFGSFDHYWDMSRSDEKMWNGSGARKHSQNKLWYILGEILKNSQKCHIQCFSWTHVLIPDDTMSSWRYTPVKDITMWGNTQSGMLQYQIIPTVRNDTMSSNTISQIWYNDNLTSYSVE